jgi:protein-S-isoprenylcysteine O-methyltransferase Ste14
MTSQDQAFRIVLLLLLLVVVAFGAYHRIQSQATRESLDRRQEGLFILLTLRPVGILFMVTVIGYLISPRVTRWSAMPLPTWLRWAGAGVGGVAAGLWVWTLRYLGKNLTDTVVTRRQHTLVTDGPYRWVRHPFL